MSKKGAFVYQQIEQTTAEWATDTTVYPSSVWLFERLTTGKFNMKLADGVRPFSQLGTVMQDVTVAVKTNNATTYVLTITTAAGAFDTPNLKPAVYTHPTFPARSAGLYKITVDAEGHVTDVVAVTKADITTLGIPAQDTNTTYLPATAAVDGLMSKADKTKLDGVAASANNYIHPAYTAKASGLYKITVDATGHISTVTAATKADITALGIPAQDTVYTHPVGAGNTHIPTGGAAGQFLKWSAAGAAVWAADNNTTYGIATTAVDGLMSKEDKARLDKAVVPNDIGTVSLGALPITKYSLKYTYTSATPIAISFAATPAEGQEFMLDILNSTAADITQPIPNAAAWQCDDTSVVLPAGKVTGISIRYVHGKYCVRF